MSKLAIPTSITVKEVQFAFVEGYYKNNAQNAYCAKYETILNNHECSLTVEKRDLETFYELRSDIHRKPYIVLRDTVLDTLIDLLKQQLAYIV